MNAFQKAQELGRDLKTTAGKAAMNLLPYVALVEIARVAMFGRIKYPPGWTWTQPTENWREVYGSAASRHVAQWLDPTLPDVDVDIDPETGEDHGSGLSHMAHVGLNAMICLWHEARELAERLVEPVEPEMIERAPVVIRPAVTGRELDGFRLWRVIVTPMRLAPDFWHIRPTDDYYDSAFLVDERRRDLVFEVPAGVAVGDIIEIDLAGYCAPARLDYMDVSRLDGRISVTLVSQ